jgi:hypothetical protein
MAEVKGLEEGPVTLTPERRVYVLPWAIMYLTMVIRVQQTKLELHGRN